MDLLDQSGKTLGDLMLDLAEEVGLARYTDENGDKIEMALPTDPTILSKLRRRVNAGYMQFLSGIDPVNGADKRYSKWAFLEREVPIKLDPTGTGPFNVAGDAGRYRLPAGVRCRPKSAWMLDTGGMYDGYTVVDTDAASVTAQLTRTSESTGCPSISACRPIDNPDGQVGGTGGAAWEVIMAPRPDAVMTLTGQFLLQPREMRDVDERHIAGSQHDQTIRMLAFLDWLRRDDPARARDQAQFASSALKSSIDLDKQMHARVRTRVTDPSCQISYAGCLTRGDVVARQRSVVTYVRS